MFLQQAFTGKNQWYLYVVTLIIVFLAIQLAGIPLAIYIFALNPAMAMQGNVSMVTNTNLGLALMLLTFTGGFFALFGCIKYIQGKKYLDIVTARPKFDYKRFFYGAGVWGILTIITVGGEIYMSDSSQFVFQFDAVNFFGLLIVSLLFFPFQTAFEELLFRGYLMQGCAILLRRRWMPLVVTSISFALLHGSNPEVADFGIAKAMPMYIIMGLIMGYVAIKDDGLELAIGLHFSNNLLSSLFISSESSALQTHALFKDLNPTMSYADSIFILIAGIIFIYICNRKYKFFHHNNLNEAIQKVVPETQEII